MKQKKTRTKKFNIFFETKKFAYWMCVRVCVCVCLSLS